ncbi:MAG TPA: hypothetical protein VF821_13665 [Lentzea sp.]
MTDADRQAAGAIAAIIGRARGDPLVTANEIIQALRTRGWRPTPAQPAPAWEPGTGRPLPPGDVHAKADAIRQAITSPLQHLDSEDVTR